LASQDLLALLRRIGLPESLGRGGAFSATLRRSADRDDASDVLRIPAGVLERHRPVSGMPDSDHIAEFECLTRPLHVSGQRFDGDLIGLERWVRCREVP
jgi:hypothetical protein